MSISASAVQQEARRIREECQYTGTLDTKLIERLSQHGKATHHEIVQLRKIDAMSTSIKAGKGYRYQLGSQMTDKTGVLTLVKEINEDAEIYEARWNEFKTVKRLKKEPFSSKTLLTLENIAWNSIWTPNGRPELYTPNDWFRRNTDLVVTKYGLDNPERVKKYKKTERVNLDPIRKKPQCFADVRMFRLLDLVLMQLESYLSEYSIRRHLS